MLKEIPRTKIKRSDYLVSLGHDEEGMYVQAEFSSGTIGNYSPVTKSEFEAILALDGVGSVGAHFIKHIRNTRQYECVSTPAESRKKKTGAEQRILPIRQLAEKGRVGSASAAIDVLHSSRNLQNIMREERSRKVN